MIWMFRMLPKGLNTSVRSASVVSGARLASNGYLDSLEARLRRSIL